jgi:hypothetical protein
MFILSVAAAGPIEIPAIFLDQSDSLTDFHLSTGSA